MTRTTRRTVLSTIALLAVAGGSGMARAQGADIARASAFIQQTGQELVAAINDTRLSLAARRERVAAVLRRAVDIQGVGRFILGRWWRQATPAEQQEYLALFEETLIRNLSARFGEYQGVRFSLGRTQQRTEDDVLVNTLIERASSAPFALDWRVAEVQGQPRVVDVIAEGTSLRLTQRSEYSSVIQRNNGQVSALLAAMRQQIQQLAAREATGAR
jgi:phospholipid transport system substrate-binding protein